MALDVNTLEKAWARTVELDQGVVSITWTAEAHGVTIEYVSYDLEAVFYVSPIWNMRQKGVSLVDEQGVMVKNERRDR
jgi:hypothetical protein